MPKYGGVYRDRNGHWYFKIYRPRDPTTGRQQQLTRGGFSTAADAKRARDEHLDWAKGSPPPAEVAPSGRADQAAGCEPADSMTVDDLLDLYLDGLDADKALSPKTRFDYRHYADRYIRPRLGHLTLQQLDPDAILGWQRDLLASGGVKTGKPLSAASVRLSRSPLAGALKLALARRLIDVNPLLAVPRPRAPRKIPRHWTPDQARTFLRSQEGDRQYPLWGFLLGSGLRIGELVLLRWANVDLDRRVVRVCEFASSLGYELVASEGKSSTAVRTIELDDVLVAMLELQRRTQAREAKRSGYEPSEYVFTRRRGGHYHPMNVSQTLARISVQAGLPRLTAHGLRHTSATLMLDTGVAPKVAAERLGHADATLFTNLYSHVTPTMQREAAEKLGRALLEG